MDRKGIVKSLRGDATASERAELSGWIDKSHFNSGYYRRVKSDYEHEVKSGKLGRVACDPPSPDGSSDRLVKLSVITIIVLGSIACVLWVICLIHK